MVTSGYISDEAHVHEFSDAGVGDPESEAMSAEMLALSSKDHLARESLVVLRGEEVSLGWLNCRHEGNSHATTLALLLRERLASALPVTQRRGAVSFVR